MDNREFNVLADKLCKQLHLDADWFCAYEIIVSQSGDIVFAFYAYRQEMYKFIGGRVFHIGHAATWVKFARENGTVRYDDYNAPFCREVALV